MATKITLNDAIVGDTLSIPLKFKDPDGAVIDVSGRTFWLTLKANPNTDDADADAQVEYLAPADATSQAGEVVLSLTAIQTAILNPISYNFDIQMKTPAAGGDEVRTIVYGRIRFVQQITRSS